MQIRIILIFKHNFFPEIFQTAIIVINTHCEVIIVVNM